MNPIGFTESIQIQRFDTVSRRQSAWLTRDHVKLLVFNIIMLMGESELGCRLKHGICYAQIRCLRLGQTGFALSSRLSPCEAPARAGESGGELTVSPPGIV